MLNRILPVIALLAAIAFAVQASAQAQGFTQPTATSSPNAPKYDGNKLIFPDGFRTSWMFVGSNYGLQYKGEGLTSHANAPGPQNAFHNVYITPDGYAGFRSSKTAFPDPTMLVVDIYGASQKEPHNILAKGYFDGDQQGALVAVKNAARPPGPNGEKTIWAYYVFPDISKPGATAAAQPDANCEACHKKNGLVDNVWVQFYPMLRDLPKSGS
ncbi:MAG TPA: cytochrome P460 family protein [Xanthobacteraceae bacterium]|nr:cytochrome P460 family protein [Xanthobacteraceae bacterium]